MRLNPELWWQDQHDPISAVVKGSALLDPGKNLVEEQSGILYELITNIESGTGDGVGECSDNNNLMVFILAHQGSL